MEGVPQTLAAKPCWATGDAFISREVQMTTEIPNDMVQFVQRMVTERRFLSESDILAEGLRLLQSRETLREEVAKGFAQLDAGLGIPAEQVYARAEERIAQIERGER
jgi:antitoxin ParD1/3/4